MTISTQGSTSAALTAAASPYGGSRTAGSDPAAFSALLDTALGNEQAEFIASGTDAASAEGMVSSGAAPAAAHAAYRMMQSPWGSRMTVAYADRSPATTPLSATSSPADSAGFPTVQSETATAAPITPEAAREVDDALTPVTVIDAPLEQPHEADFAADTRLLPQIGNAAADDLVARVMQVREHNGLPVNDGILDIATAQTGLKVLGYDIGGFGPYANGVDGVLGPVTTAALQSFQQDNGLAVTGRLDTETAKKLQLQAQPEMVEMDAAWERELSSSSLDAQAYSGTANPYWYIRFAVGKGDNAETMDNVDAAFKGRLAALARDTGHGLVFGEGYRDYDRQAYLYDQYVNHGGNLAAKPGTSQHNFGLAVDTQTGWLQQLEDGVETEDQQVLAMYGLVKPMAAGTGNAHENWHLQPLETVM